MAWRARGLARQRASAVPKPRPGRDRGEAGRREHARDQRGLQQQVAAHGREGRERADRGRPALGVDPGEQHPFDEVDRPGARRGVARRAGLPATRSPKLSFACPSPGSASRPPAASIKPKTPGMQYGLPPADRGPVGDLSTARGTSCVPTVIVRWMSSASAHPFARRPKTELSSIECGSGGEIERGRDLGQGRLLDLAYLDTTEAEKTAFLGGLGNSLGCGPQPCLGRAPATDVMGGENGGRRDEEFMASDPSLW